MATLAGGDNIFGKDDLFPNCNLPKVYAEKNLNFSWSYKEEAEPLLHLSPLTQRDIKVSRRHFNLSTKLKIFHYYYYFLFF